LREKVTKMSNLGEEVMEKGSNQEKLNRNKLEEEVMESMDRRKNRNSLKEEVTERQISQGKLKKNNLEEEVTKKRSSLEEEVTKKRSNLEEGGAEE